MQVDTGIGSVVSDIEQVPPGACIAFQYLGQRHYGLTLSREMSRGSDAPAILLLSPGHPDVKEAGVISGDQIVGTPVFVFSGATVTPDIGSIKCGQNGERPIAGSLVLAADRAEVCGHFVKPGDLALFNLGDGSGRAARNTPVSLTAWKIVQAGRDGKDRLICSIGPL